MASFLDIPFQSLGNSYENNKDKKKGSIFNDIREAKKIYENIRKTIKYVRVVASTLNPGILMAVVLFVIIIFIFFFDTQNTSGLIGGGGSGDGGTGDSTQGGGTTVPSIPGFNIEIEGPETSANGVNLEYTVTISHNPNIAPPLASIEVYDSLPTGATLVSTTGVLKDSSTNPNIWSLSDPANQAGFQIVIRPNQTDTFFDYTVSARQIAGAGGPPPEGGSSGNACTQPYEGTGYCSVENLTKTFGNENNAALVASMICQKESASNPLASSLENLPCPPDYSIGLFQINQLAHCSPAFSNPSSCIIGNQELLNACVSRFKDPIENINYAHQLYLNGGTGWTVNKWGAFAIVQKKLDECNILYR